MKTPENFEKLYNTYFKKLITICNAKHYQPFSEDIAQEAFRRLWNIWDQQSAYEPTQNFVWLVKTAHYINKEFERKTPHDQVISIEQNPSPMQRISVNPIKHIDDMIDYGLLINTLQKILSDTEFQIFCMSYQQDLSAEHIAKQLCMPAGTVRSILFRTKQKLRKYLKNKV